MTKLPLPNIFLFLIFLSLSYQTNPNPQISFIQIHLHTISIIQISPQFVSITAHYNQIRCQLTRWISRRCKRNHTPMDFLSNTAYIPVITATSPVVLVLYVYNRQQEGKKTKKHNPITETMFNQLLNFHRLYDYMTDLATTHKLQINYSFPDQATQKHRSVVVVV
ncbi:hypothetical protein HanIR_Chr04g0171211 [Helianthus annuus]|nr:hypothetical protein HanIR_Chr04g0171211 [Helianthus annuus]